MEWKTIRKYVPPFTYEEYNKEGYKKDVAAGKVSALLAEGKSFGRFAYDIFVPLILGMYTLGILSTGEINPVKIQQVLKQRQQINLEKVLENSKLKEIKKTQ